MQKERRMDMNKTLKTVLIVTCIIVGVIALITLAGQFMYVN